MDICDILHTDFEIPKSTAYRYYKDSFNLYKWEQAKPDPGKKIKDNKDTILDNVLDTAEAALADGDTISYFKGIELYSKLLTRFKKSMTSDPLKNSVDEQFINDIKENCMSPLNMGNNSPYYSKIH